MTLWHLEALRSAVRLHRSRMTQQQLAFYESHFKELQWHIARDKGFASVDEAFKQLNKGTQLSDKARNMLANLRRYLEDIGMTIGDTVVA